MFSAASTLGNAWTQLCNAIDKLLPVATGTRASLHSRLYELASEMDGLMAQAKVAGYL